MIRSDSIKPLSDFVRNTKAHIAKLKETGGPELLTVNGEAAVVIQDAASYEELATLAEQARQDSRLQEAMKYFREGGEGITMQDVYARLDAKFL